MLSNQIFSSGTFPIYCCYKYFYDEHFCELSILHILDYFPGIQEKSGCTTWKYLWIYVYSVKLFYIDIFWQNIHLK